MENEGAIELFYDNNGFPLNPIEDILLPSSTDEESDTDDKYESSSSDSSLEFIDLTSTYSCEELTLASARMGVPDLQKYTTIDKIVPLSFLPRDKTTAKIFLDLSARDIEYVSLTRINNEDKAIYPTAIVVRMFSLFGDMVVEDSPRMINVWVNDKIVNEDSGKWWISNGIKLCPFMKNVVELLWCNNTIREYLVTVEIVQEIDEDVVQVSSGLSNQIQYEVVDLTEDDD